MNPTLETLPERMRHLKIDKRGYPVPWFVAWVNGEPEFRAMDADKWKRAVRDSRCWVCGGSLYQQELCFVIGPMCGINRTTSEPPSHVDCGQWSARNCPFLTQRETKRRVDEMTKKCPYGGGIGIDRQPGVALLWITGSYSVFSDGNGGWLITVGEPKRVEWWSHGRRATREEVAASVDSGLPLLMDLAESEGAEAVAELLRQKQDFWKLYPA